MLVCDKAFRFVLYWSQQYIEIKVFSQEDTSQNSLKVYRTYFTKLIFRLLTNNSTFAQVRWVGYPYILILVQSVINWEEWEVRKRNLKIVCQYQDILLTVSLEWNSRNCISKLEVNNVVFFNYKWHEFKTGGAHVGGQNGEDKTHKAILINFSIWWIWWILTSLGMKLI